MARAKVDFNKAELADLQGRFNHGFSLLEGGMVQDISAALALGEYVSNQSQRNVSTGSLSPFSFGKGISRILCCSYLLIGYPRKKRNNTSKS
jgi:hypothetical protein